MSPPGGWTSTPMQSFGNGGSSFVEFITNPAPHAMCRRNGQADVDLQAVCGASTNLV